MTKQIYKVQLYGGYVGLIAADSLVDAQALARCDQGRSNVQSVTLANAEDLAWVKAMGGPVPDIKPKLPSEWAREGYYVVEGRDPKPGMQCDYYDREGIKRQGTVAVYDGASIVIDGERKTIVRETFKVRHGR